MSTYVYTQVKEACIRGRAFSLYLSLFKKEGRESKSRAVRAGDPLLGLQLPHGKTPSLGLRASTGPLGSIGTQFMHGAKVELHLHAV